MSFTLQFSVFLARWEYWPTASGQEFSDCPSRDLTALTSPLSKSWASPRKRSDSLSLLSDDLCWCHWFTPCAKEEPMIKALPNECHYNYEFKLKKTNHSQLTLPPAHGCWFQGASLPRWDNQVEAAERGPASAYLRILILNFQGIGHHSRGGKTPPVEGKTFGGVGNIEELALRDR